MGAACGRVVGGSEVGGDVTGDGAIVGTGIYGLGASVDVYGTGEGCCPFPPSAFFIRFGERRDDPFLPLLPLFVLTSFIAVVSLADFLNLFCSGAPASALLSIEPRRMKRSCLSMCALLLLTALHHSIDSENITEWFSTCIIVQM